MTDEELERILDVPFKFWACLDCNTYERWKVRGGGAYVRWEGDLATCEECGRTNRDQRSQPALQRKGEPCRSREVLDEFGEWLDQMKAKVADQKGPTS